MYEARLFWNSISSANIFSSSCRVLSSKTDESVDTGLNPGERMGSSTARRNLLVGRRVLAKLERNFGGVRSIFAQPAEFIWPLSL